uniref:Uncharacterized protein n=1 Tax=Piliocolobus tephrosceles TaxID=591936 RepID=A0A8C9IH49_9PRIM
TGTSSTDSQQAGHRRCSACKALAENLTCLSLPVSPGAGQPLREGCVAVRAEVGIPAPHLSGQDPQPSPAFLGCPWGLWAEINPLCLAPGPPSGKVLRGRWFFPGCSLPTGGAQTILLLWTWRHFLNWALQQREENSGRARHIPPVPRTAPVSKEEGGHPPQNPNGEKVKTTTPDLGLHQSLMSDPTVAILRARRAPEAPPPQSCSGSLTACLQHGCVALNPRDAEDGRKTARLWGLGKRTLGRSGGVHAVREVTSTGSGWYLEKWGDVGTNRRVPALSVLAWPPGK